LTIQELVSEGIWDKVDSINGEKVDDEVIDPALMIKLLYQKGLKVSSYGEYFLSQWFTLKFPLVYLKWLPFIDSIENQ